MNPLESIAYGLARGVVRAWFDVRDERSKAVEEKPNADDLARAAHFRAAVMREYDPSDTGRSDSPPDRK